MWWVGMGVADRSMQEGLWRQRLKHSSGVRCAVILHVLPVAVRAVMPPGMYHTALPYRALLVLGSAALLAPQLQRLSFGSS